MPQGQPKNGTKSSVSSAAEAALVSCPANID
jgi:hypothetical protein